MYPGVPPSACGRPNACASPKSSTFTAPSVAEEHVRRLEVAVDDPVRVRVRDALAPPPARSGPPRRSGSGRAGAARASVSPAQELEDEVRARARSARVEQRHDVRVLSARRASASRRSRSSRTVRAPRRRTALKATARPSSGRAPPRPSRTRRGQSRARARTGRRPRLRPAARPPDANPARRAGDARERLQDGGQRARRRPEPRTHRAPRRAARACPSRPRQEGK